MAYETLLVERIGPENQMCVVTLNRPHVLNAMNTRMGVELRDLFGKLRHDRELRCVILTGAGEKAFCTGADLKERDGMTDQDFISQHQVFEEALFEALLAVEIPTIAAVEGYCFAGGFEIALACDWIVASESAQFALTEVTRGIMPGGGSTVFLPRAAGKAFAKEVILTGRRIPAEEAYRRNVVNQLVPAGTARSEALKMAETVANNAPIGVRQAKKAIDRGMDADQRTALAFTIEAYNILIGTEDRREGIRAFNEKRAPHFQNK
jgi:enoyl-CoA hydratase